jgi:glucose uptake protein
VTLLGLLYGVITVLAWGTWLAPSENVVLPNSLARAFYVAVGNLILATIVLCVVGVEKLTGQVFLYPFVGGLIWSLGALSAFTGIPKIGMARAFGTWAPLNIVIGIVWGMVLFGEFLRSGPTILSLAIISILVIIGGILLIIFSGGAGDQKVSTTDMLIGFGGAIGAGILWGSYFVPSAYLARQLEGMSGWIAAFPLAVGMFVGSGALAALSGKAPVCKGAADYGRVILSGLLWSVGNFAMLLMVGEIGMGKGFTIAQLCVVVNALIGIFLLKEPPPKSRAAKLTLAGVLIATIGGVVLGNLKEGL